MTTGQTAALVGLALVVFLLWRESQRQAAAAAAHAASVQQANQMIGWVQTAVLSYFGA